MNHCRLTIISTKNSGTREFQNPATPASSVLVDISTVGITTSVKLVNAIASIIIMISIAVIIIIN